MNLLKRLQKIWHEDRLLQGIIRNTGYLFSSNTITMVLGMAQSILAARLLGVAALGVLGTITVFASTVNRLFSFRMGDLVVKYFGGYLEEGDLPRAGSLVKVAASIESITSVVAFLVLLFLAPVASAIFAKDPSLTVWFRVYGVFILGSLIDETAVAVLHVTGRFRSQAILNLAQSILTAVVIGLAFLLQAGLPLVLFAYLAGKIVLGFGGVFLAARSLRRVLGARWWRQPMVQAAPVGRIGPLCGFHQPQHDDQPGRAGQRAVVGGVFPFAPGSWLLQDRSGRGQHGRDADHAFHQYDVSQDQRQCGGQKMGTTAQFTAAGDDHLRRMDGGINAWSACIGALVHSDHVWRGISSRSSHPAGLARWVWPGQYLLLESPAAAGVWQTNGAFLCNGRVWVGQGRVGLQCSTGNGRNG